MAKRKPKVLYTNFVNLSGLYSKRPIPCYSNKEFGDYWDETGDVNAVNKNNDGIIQFTSKSKKEVELWTKGAVAVMSMLKKWSH